MSELENEDVTLYLKAECVQVREGIFMSQRGYPRHILECFDMLECQALATPMVERPRLEPDIGEEEVDSIFYEKIIGKLIHLTHAHPDLSYCVGIVSSFMSKPQLSHLQACKRIFRYDPCTWDYRILFRNHEIQSSILSGFVDKRLGRRIFFRKDHY